MEFLKALRIVKIFQDTSVRGIRNRAQGINSKDFVEAHERINEHNKEVMKRSKKRAMQKMR